MKRVIFVVSLVQRGALSCRWIETGNPAQPLACIWATHDQHLNAKNEESEVEPWRLCA